jgi:hypothetical protein
LLKLPTEVKQRIWSLAVTVEDPVVPQQIRDKSNKFIWSKDQINKKTHAIEIGAVPQLAAVQLGRVCRSIYDDVATTHVCVFRASFLPSLSADVQKALLHGQ